MQPESCASEYSGQDYFTEIHIQFISTLNNEINHITNQNYYGSESGNTFVFWKSSGRTVHLVKIDAYSWRESLNSKKCCFRPDGLAAIRKDTKSSGLKAHT